MSEIKYNEAIAEIENILRQIENEEMDVDDLSGQGQKGLFPA
jgi:exonuclease VII small subunit